MVMWVYQMGLAVDPNRNARPTRNNNLTATAANSIATPPGFQCRRYAAPYGRLSVYPQPRRKRDVTL